MDKHKQKNKKDKTVKQHEKGMSSFTADIKNIKENLKIKEILKTVKINSSMRLKAPRGSKVLSQQDLSEHGEQEAKEVSLHVSPTNPAGTSHYNSAHIKGNQENEISLDRNDVRTVTVPENIFKNEIDDLDSMIQESIRKFDEVINSVSNEMSECSVAAACEVGGARAGTLRAEARARKLSLDHAALARADAFSQSEVDLHSVGKLPLERKSSFFRKKMESFLRNTSDVFRRQSVRRRTSISYSMQSLDNGDYSGRYLEENYTQTAAGGSMSSLTTSSTLARSSSSTSSRPESRVHRASCADIMSDRTDASVKHPPYAPRFPSDTMLAGSHTLKPGSYSSLGSSSQQPLSARAISMSSGLDGARRAKRAGANRANRVTWLASEGLTNYLRRAFQEEQGIGGSSGGGSGGERGRRLSYQRAVSGEEPRRQKLIPEHPEGALEKLLSELTANGVPSLHGYTRVAIQERARNLIDLREADLKTCFDWKALTPREQLRQAAILELICTEASYIGNLTSLVQVFLSAVHTVQTAGLMRHLETQILFNNLPDVLDANLKFWEASIFPMLAEALDSATPFNVELMVPGFMRFRELFLPYEKYVAEQSQTISYLGALSTDSDFAAFLNWCRAHPCSKRLQLKDFLAMPWQRLTKYELIIKEITAATDEESQRTKLSEMGAIVKQFVRDVNRATRQREELLVMERLMNIIGPFEIEFKDEEMDRLFGLHLATNLDAPMLGCHSYQRRTLVHEGELKFKDPTRDARVDVYCFLLTDMLLICKKMKSGAHSFKLIRQKYMLNRLEVYPQYNKHRPTELVGVIFVLLDDVSSAYTSFAITDAAREAGPNALRIWNQKIREAKLTYVMSIWIARNPSWDLADLEVDTSFEHSVGQSTKDITEQQTIEREARERVATMLYRTGYYTEHKYSQPTDFFDVWMAMHARQLPVLRSSTASSSRNSRLSSFQHSTSAPSHDEPSPGPSSRNLYCAGSSVEHLIPGSHPNQAATSITVKVSEGESEAAPEDQSTEDVHYFPPSYTSTHDLFERSPCCTCECHNVRAAAQAAHVTYLAQAAIAAELAAAAAAPGHLYTLPSLRQMAGPLHRPAATTLRVQPAAGVMALVRSLPDLSVEPTPRRPAQPPPHAGATASQKMYQLHDEKLGRKRVRSTTSHQHYLTPDARGTSYPPPSPTRGSLQRSGAITTSFRITRRLEKWGHVMSESQLQGEEMATLEAEAPSTSPSPTPSPPPPAADVAVSKGKGKWKGKGRGKKGKKGRTSPISTTTTSPRHPVGAVDSEPQPCTLTAPILPASQILPAPPTTKSVPRRKGFLMKSRRTVSGSDRSTATTDVESAQSVSESTDQSECALQVPSRERSMESRSSCELGRESEEDLYEERGALNPFLNYGSMSSVLSHGPPLEPPPIFSSAPPDPPPRTLVDAGPHEPPKFPVPHLQTGHARLQRRSRQFTGHLQQIADLSEQIAGQSQQIAEQSQQIAGPSQQMAGPSQQIAGPSQQIAALSQQIAGPSSAAAAVPQLPGPSTKPVKRPKKGFFATARNTSRSASTKDIKEKARKDKAPK